MGIEISAFQGYFYSIELIIVKKNKMDNIELQLLDDYADSRRLIVREGSLAWETDWALEFDSTKIHHVNHGIFHVPNVNYGNFFAEFLIKPVGSGYFWSDGYGGAHALLFGVTAVSGGFVLTGNVYDSDNPPLTTFLSTDIIRANEWAHVAVSYDGTWITTHINGVPSAIVAKTGNRKITNSFEAVAFIGGSDHNQFSGRIGMIRIFEGTTLGLGPSATFRPNINPSTAFLVGSSMVSANFLADYRNKTLEDYSIGLNGVKHNGFLAEANGGANDLGTYSTPSTYGRNVAKFPKWVIDPFVYTGVAALKTPIANARIYDDFSGVDVHPGNSQTLGLGVTRIGNKTWVAPNYGKMNGNTFFVDNFSSPSTAIVSDNQTNGTVILRKPLSTPVSTTFTTTTHCIIYRYIDGNNYNMLYVDNYGQGYLYKVVSGTPTSAGAFTFGTSWTEMKVIATGTTIQAYADGVLKTTETISQNASGTGKGFLAAHPLARVSEFAVI